MNIFRYRSPVGVITIVSDEIGCTQILFDDERNHGALFAPSAHTNQAATQLQEYFAGKRTTFDFPIHLVGSDFQQKIWMATRNIPYGTTISVSELANAIGESGNHRAVGAAISKNPLPIVIPTHRVVNAQGSALGVGKSSQRKNKLIEFESRWSAKGN